MATGSIDGNLKLWDVVPEQERDTLRGDQLGVTCLAFSPDDRILATGGWDGRTKLWSISNRPSPGALEGTEEAEVRSVAFAPDGKTLVTGCSDGVVGCGIWKQKNCRRTLVGHTDQVRCSAFAPDGRTLATGSDDKTVILWDVHTGRAPSRPSRPSQRDQHLGFLARRQDSGRRVR